MPDRRFFTVSCPFCREMVFESPDPGPIIVREGAAFSIATTSREDLVEVVGSWSINPTPAFRVQHRCPSLRPPLTPDEAAELRARAIDFGARLAGEMFGNGGDEG